MVDKAQALHHELEKVIPQFVKRAKKNEYLMMNEDKTREVINELFLGVKLTNLDTDDVELFVYDPENFEDNVVVEMISQFSKFPKKTIREKVKTFSAEEKIRIIDAYVGERKSRRDRPGRALEFGYPLTFEITGTFAEYRDLQRHNILTQYRQDLTTDIGFVLADEIREIGFDEKVLEVEAMSEEMENLMIDEGFGKEAQYAVLFNHKVRWTMGLNFRELMHLAELRTQKAGHQGYRSICQKMQKLALDRYPSIARLNGFVDFNKYSLARDDSEARTHRKNREKGLE